MNRIEKVKKYLEVSKYSETRIEEILSNPKICNAIYNRLAAYEIIHAEMNASEVYNKVNGRRTR